MANLWDVNIALPVVFMFISNEVFFECEKCAILLSAGIHVTSQWVGLFIRFSAKSSIII